MVLQHILDRPIFVKIISPILDTNIFIANNLDGINIFIIPEWLQNSICKPKQGNIPHQFFA